MKFNISSVAVTIQELFESKQSPSKIFDLLKSRASRPGVYKFLKRLKETGLALPKERSPPSHKVRTPKLIKNTREKIRRNPRRSVRKFAYTSGVSCGTMQTVLKNDLNLSPYKITKAQLLFPRDQETAKSKASSGESEGWHATSAIVNR